MPIHDLRGASLDKQLERMNALEAMGVPFKCLYCQQVFPDFKGYALHHRAEHAGQPGAVAYTVEEGEA